MMKTEERARATNTGLSADALDRLALFAEWTGTTPPEVLTEEDEDGPTFSREMLAYCNRFGLNLDWLVLADERGLVMAYHRAAKGGAA